MAFDEYRFRYTERSRTRRGWMTTDYGWLLMLRLDVANRMSSLPVVALTGTLAGLRYHNRICHVAHPLNESWNQLRRPPGRNTTPNAGENALELHAAAFDILGDEPTAHELRLVLTYGFGAICFEKQKRKQLRLNFDSLKLWVYTFDSNKL